eukprot:scaffold3168_cov65-Phaeocystis_antarctica.AAC.1
MGRIWVITSGGVKHGPTGQLAEHLAPQALRWPTRWPTPEIFCFPHRAGANSDADGLLIQRVQLRATGRATDATIRDLFFTDIYGKRPTCHTKSARPAAPPAAHGRRPRDSHSAGPLILKIVRGVRARRKRVDRGPRAAGAGVARGFRV